jgi:hypothetical protein
MNGWMEGIPTDSSSSYTTIKNLHSIEERNMITRETETEQDGERKRE